MDHILPLGKLISILHRQEQKYINTVMKQYGLGYSGYNFLIYLSKNEGISQKQLCQILFIDEALATRTMKGLEQQGLIIRTKDKDTSRSYAIFLTDKGKAMIPKLFIALSELWDELSEGLTTEETTLLSEQLQQMAEKAVLKNQAIAQAEQKDET